MMFCVGYGMNMVLIMIWKKKIDGFLVWCVVQKGGLGFKKDLVILMLVSGVLRWKMIDSKGVLGVEESK